MAKIQMAQQDDARMVAELEIANHSDADWKADLIRQRMVRRQRFAAHRDMPISPVVCSCGRIVESLVGIYHICDECVTDHVASEEMLSR